MQRSILVPLDGSPTSEDALPMAAALARRRQWSIELLLVREPVASPGTIHGPTAEIRARDAAERAAAQHYLDGIVAHLLSQGVPSARGMVVDGEVVSTIRTRAEHSGAGLIAMCTHGRGGWSRFWLGSVAQELIRRVHYPLLLTRPHGQDEGQAAPPPSDGPVHVLVTLDGSVFAEQALDVAMQLFGAHETEYTLLRIVRPGSVAHGVQSFAPLGEEDDVAQLAEAERYLTRVVEGLRAADTALSIKPVAIVRQHVAVGIAEYANEMQVDAIAIATHARSGMPRLIVGSVADKVLRATPIPVLMYRPPIDQAAPLDDVLDSPALAIPPVAG